MEATRSSIVVSLALVILVTWIWKVFVCVWVRPKRLERLLREQGLKGNSYRFWHGDFQEMKRMTLQAQAKAIGIFDDIRPHALPFHHHIIQKFGKNTFVWNGPTPRVIVMEPDLVKEILFKSSIYQKAASNPLTKFLICGLVSYEGQQWIKHRKILNPAFHLDKLKKMLPAIYLSCGDIVKKWEMLMPETAGSVEVDIWSSMADLSADVISRTAFGSNYQEGKRIFELQQEQAILTHQVIQSNYIPGWRFLPTKSNKRMRQIDNEVRSVLMGIISRRDKAMKAGQYIAEDLLGVLMESNFREIQESGYKRSVGMTISEVIDECKLFYFAGQESSSNLLTWTLVMLSIHQNWQAQARAEVLQAFGEQQPDFEKLSHLKIVNMILHEVMRLYPPAVMLLRIIHEKTKLGDMSIPPEAELLLPVLIIHRDTEIWGADAKEFNPKRFSKGVAKAAKNPAAFLPFGSGPRICIGQYFALLEAKLVIAIILQHFSFELSPSYQHAPFPGLTLQPRNGAKVILQKI